MQNIFQIKACSVFRTGKTDSTTDGAYFPAGLVMKYFQCPGRNEEIIPKSSIVRFKKRYPGSWSQSQAFHSCFLRRDTAHKTLHIKVKPFFIFRIWSNGKLFHTGQDMIPQIILKGFTVLMKQ